MITAVRWIPRSCVAIASSSEENPEASSSIRAQLAALRPDSLGEEIQEEEADGDINDDDEDEDEDEGWITDEDAMADNVATTATASAAAAAAAAAAAGSSEDKVALMPRRIMTAFLPSFGRRLQTQFTISPHA